MTVSIQDICRASGATYRQVKRWSDEGYIRDQRNRKPGPGVPYEFDESVIPKVALMVQVSKFIHTFSLREIADNFDLGYVERGELTLSWDTVDILRSFDTAIRGIIPLAVIRDEIN